jgi:hypothetical protein
MATNWYDPNGAGSGFYNSPQDFLFKSQGGTWYGQGAAGQDDAAKMPTMADYYFGGPQQQTQPAPQQFSPMGGGGGMSEGLPFAPHTQTRLGGGGSINLGNNVSVPQGPLWQRYQALQANPEMMEADPAFQYLMSSGEQALGRSAGARRKRFSGETMLDFQKHGQGQAANYLQRMLPELRAGAGQEYGMLENEARAKSQRAGMEAIASDPYGRARGAASQFANPQAYAQSVSSRYGPRRPGDSAPFNVEDLIREWQLGQRLNQASGF